MQSVAQIQVHLELTRCFLLPCMFFSLPYDQSLNLNLNLLRYLDINTMWRKIHLHLEIEGHSRMSILALLTVRESLFARRIRVSDTPKRYRYRRKGIYLRRMR